TTNNILDTDYSHKGPDSSNKLINDIGRKVGTRIGKIGALRKSLTRIESRVVDASKDHVARAGEAAGFSDRLTRLEGRISDLTKEQLARAVETAGLRERLFRVEQRTNGIAATSTAPADVPDAPPLTITAED